MTETKRGRFVLLLTFVILLLGFFSSQLTYTGDFHFQSMGHISALQSNPTCSDLKRLVGVMDHGMYNQRFDTDVDGDVDEADYAFFAEAIKDNPNCPLPDDCFEGDTSCRYGVLNVCERGPFGLRWVEQPTPSGQYCTSRGQPRYTQTFYG